VHGERVRLARRAVRPARHTGRPQAFGTPWVATCIPRGRGIRHARRVRSPKHAMLLFQPLFPVSLFLKDRVLIRLPDTLRRTDSLEGRKAGKTCRKRSFSAFLPSKSALCQATGYAGDLAGTGGRWRGGNCKLRISGLQPSFASARNPVLNRRRHPRLLFLPSRRTRGTLRAVASAKNGGAAQPNLTRTHEKHPRHHRGSPRNRHQRLRTQEAGARLHGRQVLLREKEVAPVLKTSSKQWGALETVRPVCLPSPISSARYLPPADW
jgi:hypothetical protein